MHIGREEFHHLIAVSCSSTDQHWEFLLWHIPKYVAWIESPKFHYFHCWTKAQPQFLGALCTIIIRPLLFPPIAIISTMTHYQIKSYLFVFLVYEPSPCNNTIDCNLKLVPFSSTILSGLRTSSFPKSSGKPDPTTTMIFSLCIETCQLPKHLQQNYWQI